MNEQELVEWLEIAQMDLASANHLITLYPVPFEVICYLSQQAGEKYLKGFLCYHGELIPKTHDLGELCLRCTQIDPSFLELQTESGELAFFATATRYPNRPEILESDMKSALKSAETIEKFVKIKLEIK